MECRTKPQGWLIAWRGGGQQRRSSRGFSRGAIRTERGAERYRDPWAILLLLRRGAMHSLNFRSVSRSRLLADWNKKGRGPIDQGKRHKPRSKSSRADCARKNGKTRPR